jgi:Delta14-sterol reductase
MSSTTLNPRSTTYEFFGPPGALFVTLAVPITIYGLYFGCSEQTGGCPPSPPNIVPSIIDAVGNLKWWKSLWDTQATIMYFAWYAFCVVSWKVLPGDWIEGVTLRTGGKIKYKINGAPRKTLFVMANSNIYVLAFSTFLFALGLTSGVIMTFGPEAFTFFYRKWVGFVTAALLMSVLQGLACYAASFRSDALLALGGNTGNHIYDVRVFMVAYLYRLISWAI